MPKSLGFGIRTLRERAGISQYALARATGIDPAILSRLESGVRESIRFEYLVAIAEALEVSLDDVAAEAGFTRRRSGAAVSPTGALPRLLHGIESAQRHLERAQESLSSASLPGPRSKAKSRGRKP